MHSNAKKFVLNRICNAQFIDQDQCHEKYPIHEFHIMVELVEIKFQPSIKDINSPFEHFACI